MTSVYVDEATGSDLTGDGSQQAPYQSLAYALFIQGQSAKVLVRKDANAEYDEPTQSALKKAKKGADGLEKKRRKAEEIAEREAQANNEEREKRERLLEESKKIQLVEDATLPAAVKVRTTSDALMEGTPTSMHFIGKDSGPHTFTGKARATPRLGTPLTLTKRHHIYRSS
jgi:asparaginyl-tRNA synthetase